LNLAISRFSFPYARWPTDFGGSAQVQLVTPSTSLPPGCVRFCSSVLHRTIPCHAFVWTWASRRMCHDNCSRQADLKPQGPQPLYSSARRRRFRFWDSFIQVV
jgi:hypothetical protein